MEAVDARAASTPTGSRAPAAFSTTRLTPKAATAPVSTLRAVGRCPSRPAERPTTISGPTEPTTAAMPPGSRYADRNSSGKKAPMFSAPSTVAFHHQAPRGSTRASARSTRPAGRARISPVKSGRSGGRNWVVTA
jgi:hypothetical protein